MATDTRLGEVKINRGRCPISANSWKCSKLVQRAKRNKVAWIFCNARRKWLTSRVNIDSAVSLMENFQKKK